MNKYEEDMEWLHYYGPELEDAWAEMDDEEDENE